MYFTSTFTILYLVLCKGLAWTKSEVDMFCDVTNSGTNICTTRLEIDLLLMTFVVLPSLN